MMLDDVSVMARRLAGIGAGNTPSRMAENLNVFGFALTDGEMSRIATLDTGTSVAFDHHDPKMVGWLNSRALELPGRGSLRTRP